MWCQGGRCRSSGGVGFLCLPLIPASTGRRVPRLWCSGCLRVLRLWFHVRSFCSISLTSSECLRCRWHRPVVPIPSMNVMVSIASALSPASSGTTSSMPNGWKRSSFSGRGASTACKAARMLSKSLLPEESSARANLSPRNFGRVGLREEVREQHDQGSHVE